MNSTKDVIMQKDNDQPLTDMPAGHGYLKRWDGTNAWQEVAPKLTTKDALFKKRLLLDLIALDNRVVDLERRIRYLTSLAAKPRR